MLPKPPDGLCLMCKQPVPGASFWCCRCQRPCDGEITSLQGSSGGVFSLIDLKSSCCKADVIVQTRMTCSAVCHEAFVAQVERNFGVYKKIVRQTTGEAFKVPTRLIIEQGLKESELDQFPRWSDTDDGPK